MGDRIDIDVHERENELSESLEARRWKHRRRLGYASFVSVTILVVLILLAAVFAPNVIDSVEKVSDVLSTYVVLAMGVTAAYMGAATVAEVKTRIKR